MKAIFFLITALFFSSLLPAQNLCSVKNAQAYYYSVMPGDKPVTLDINGKEENKILTRTNISIYLNSTCVHTPVIFFSTLGKLKMKPEFIRVTSNKDEAGVDENGILKIIKASKNTFLWKAIWVVQGRAANFENEKIIIKGIIGSKKFNVSILSPIKLQPVAMY